MLEKRNVLVLNPQSDKYLASNDKLQAGPASGPQAFHELLLVQVQVLRFMKHVRIRF